MGHYEIADDGIEPGEWWEQLVACVEQRKQGEQFEPVSEQ